MTDLRDSSATARTRAPATASRDESARTGVQRRRDRRGSARLRASTATIDPIPDPHTGIVSYWTSDDDDVVNLSRRGLCLVSDRPPGLGTRLLVQLHVPDQSPIEFVGRTRWARVQFERGREGARARCAVGVEVVGGDRSSLDRYEQAVGGALSTTEESVATPEDLG